MAFYSLVEFFNPLNGCARPHQLTTSDDFITGLLAARVGPPAWIGYRNFYFLFEFINPLNGCADPLFCFHPGDNQGASR